jgi:hypothetical protein
MMDRHARRSRGPAYVAAAVTLAALIGGVTWVTRGDGVTPVSNNSNDDSVNNEWQVVPHAFDVYDGWMSGPRLVLPAGNGCFLGFGQDSTGYGLTPAYWQATGDCTSAVNISPTRRPPVDGLPSKDRAGVIAGVPAHDGGYLVLSRHTFYGDAFAYETSVLAGDAQRGFTQVAQFATNTPKASHVGPDAIVSVAGGYAAIGRRDNATVAWTSADGRTWQSVDVAAQNTSPLALTAGPDGRLVAVGIAGLAAVGWTSTDQGATWTAAQLPDLGGRPQLGSVFYTGQQYVALGGVTVGSVGHGVMLTSPDGLQWSQATVDADMGIIQKGVATPGGSIVAVTAAAAAAPRPDEQCALAWGFDGTAWTSVQLGCAGVPETLTVLADGRIAGAHWETLFLRQPGAT